MTDAIYRACADAVHVLTADGRLLRAGRAVLFVLGELGYARTERVFGSRPLLPLIEWGYALVARNRTFFGRFLFRREDPRV